MLLTFLFFIGGGVLEYRFGNAVYCGYYSVNCNQYDFKRTSNDYSTDLDARTLKIPLYYSYINKDDNIHKSEALKR